MMTISPYTRIFIDNLAIEAPVGFCDWEKHAERPSVLHVSVELFSTRTHWADIGGAYMLEGLIDYTKVHDHVLRWQSRPHTESLEELCDDLFAFCFSDPRVSSCRLKIVKPNVYANAAGVGVEIFRLRGEV